MCYKEFRVLTVGQYTFNTILRNSSLLFALIRYWAISGGVKTVHLFYSSNVSEGHRSKKKRVRYAFRFFRLKSALWASCGLWLSFPEFVKPAWDALIHSDRDFFEEVYHLVGDAALLRQCEVDWLNIYVRMPHSDV